MPDITDMVDVLQEVGDPVHYRFRRETSCGKVIGGMFFESITMKPEHVTCKDCLATPNYPLHQLGNTLL